MFFIRLWFKTQLIGKPVPLKTLLTMPARKVRPGVVVPAYAEAAKAGLDISLEDLERHYLCAGNVAMVVQAMITASRLGRVGRIVR